MCMESFMKCMCDKSMFEQQIVDMHVLHTTEMILMHIFGCVIASIVSCLAW